MYAALLPVFPPGSLVQYYVAAASTATSGAASTFFPRDAEFQPLQVQLPFLPGTSPVCINEFLAVNTAVIRDPAGEWEDHVELCNTAAVPAVLDGMYLTDDLQNPTKFRLPIGTTIPPHGRLLVWCDEDGVQGPLHANFKLSGNGEDIAMFAADGVTLLDSFRFGPQVANVATGRLFDGALPWVSLPAPTPNAPNDLAGCGVRAYSALAYASHALSLEVGGAPAVGDTFSFVVVGGRPQAPGVLVLSPQPAYAVSGAAIVALVDLGPASVWQPLVLDPSGAGVVPVAVPPTPNLVGLRSYAQVAVFGGVSLGASNALEIVICP